MDGTTPKIETADLSGDPPQPSVSHELARPMARADRYERLEVQRITIDEMRAEIDRLIPIANAAMALRDKLKAIHDDPAFKSVWMVNQLHAGPYQGPTYTAELAALDAALDAIPSAKGA